MSDSFRIINYALRPGKAIERRMLCAAFERLHPFQRIQEYRYVGFGSIYFSDFQLLHRELGITNMLSIEKETSSRACFRFNRPYRCIQLKFANSGEVLPTIDWRRRTIAWLDYENRLDTGILGDIATVCLRAASGSSLVVTVNAHPDAEPAKEDRETYEKETGKTFDLDEYRLRIAKELLGGQLPAGTSGTDLRGQGLASVFRKVIDNVISEQISLRNSMLPLNEKVQYRQLFHFRYKDGAQMVTVGGIFFRAEEEQKFLECNFDTLPFIRASSDPCHIKAPCLTPKEIRHLNSQLPKISSGKLRVPGVPESDVKRYAEVYRYFPSFSEVLFP
ncbi:MAG: hypothetical protein HYT87_01435 [Nitrospirae bacterium]|nr:hypothetical protein [Nitrospirota bacterium]